MQIVGYAVLNLLHPPCHLGLGEVPVPIVDRLELAAVDGNACHRQKPDPAAQLDKLRTHLADRSTVVFAKVGNRLVIRHQAARQPHHLDIAACFSLQPTARLHRVEIAVEKSLSSTLA